jgi:uncharacterized protein
MKKFIFIITLISVTGAFAQTSKQKLKKLIKHGDFDGLKTIIAKGQDINTIYSGKETALHFAVIYKKFEIVKYLVEKGALLNIQDKIGNTPLMWAISLQDSIASYLISKGSDLNCVGIYGSTPLKIAVGSGGETNTFILRQLLEKGADLNFRCSECCNRSAFMDCCIYGTPEDLSLFVKFGADINQVDCKGKNGLIYAIKTKDFENAEYLIKSGVNIKQKDHKNRTALYYARKKKIPELENLLK